MANEDQIYEWAEEAVGAEIVELRPDLATRWRGAIPKNLGLDQDNWLALSAKMIKRFNRLSGQHPVTMSEPARAAYRSKALISFVTGIADLADQA